MPAKQISSSKTLFDQDKDTKINHFLSAAPFLSFSDKGLENIAKRFGLTLDELKQKISDFEAKEGQKHD